MTNFNNVVASSIFDDFDVFEEKPKEKVETLHFKTDPLAKVVSILRQGHPYYVAYHQVRDDLIRRSYSEGSDPDIDPVTPDDKLQATKIRRLFNTRMIMWRLQAKPISEFMEKLERILNDELTLDTDCIAVLVKMPTFYDEVKKTTKAFKGAVDVPVSYGRESFYLESPIEFKQKVYYSANDSKFTVYYWQTPEGYIIGIQARPGQQSSVPWDFVAQAKNVGIKGTFYVSKRQGYDLRIARPQGDNYELYHTGA